MDSIAFPGPKSAKMLGELGRYVVAEPYPFVLDLERCQGMELVTIDGQRLFDWAGYYGSKLIGHNHPGLYEPEYVTRLVRAANNKVANPDFLTQECLDYYRLLIRLAPEVMKNDRLEVYAVNSGAEAVENMMKYMIARFNAKRAKVNGVQGHRRFIYFDKAFHGRTVFALGVTQTIDPVATKDFHGLGATGNIKLPWPTEDTSAPREENVRRMEQTLHQIESALELMRDEIVGIVLEPIQGAGGHRTALPEFFTQLHEIADRYGVAIGYDEVQTGLGATGKMWAIDHFKLSSPPLAVASGKKFGNGVVYMMEPLEDIGVLDSTWGGTLADMVRVVQEVAIMEREGLVAKAAQNGERLAIGLREIERDTGKISNVRGYGLYQGFSLPTPEEKGSLVRRAMENGLLLLGAGANTIRTRPNLSCTSEDVDRLLTELRLLL